jgi:hypothetical protein
MNVSHNATAARHTARQILDGEFEMMNRRQLSDLWFLISTNLREPKCPEAFAYLQKWLRTYNDQR